MCRVVLKGDSTFALTQNERGILVSNRSRGLGVLGALIATYELGVDSGESN